MFTILLFCPLMAYSGDSQILQNEEVVASDVANDDDQEVEVLNGYVEYYPDGTVFFDQIKDAEGVFLNIKNPSTYNQYSVLDIKGVNYEDIKNRQAGVKQHYANEHQVDNFVTSYTEKLGKFSFGTIYGADIDTGEYEYSTKFFARYDTKRFGIQAAFGKDSYMSTGTQADHIYLTPEIKLGKGFVLSDTFKANVLGTRNDNTIMLKYTPQFIKENPLDVGVGIGQAYYQNGNRKNVVKFETTLRL